MAREKFGTLTEQMFYILLCLREECCGMDVMARVGELTGGRVAVGPGTLYNLLEQFLAAGYIVETRAEGRRRSYQLTARGKTPHFGTRNKNMVPKTHWVCYSDDNLARKKKEETQWHNSDRRS